MFARRGALVAINTQTRARLWTRRMRDIGALQWSRGGELLLVRGHRSLVVLDARGRLRFDLLRPELAAPVTAAALAPNGRTLAFVQRAGEQSHLWLIPALRPDGAAARRVFAGHGAFTALEWSPNGRWLLVAWPNATQWLFLRSAGVRGIDGVPDISGQFEGSFPMLGGWCCPPPEGPRPRARS